LAGAQDAWMLYQVAVEFFRYSKLPIAML
jgi:hypothetical protein